MKKIILFIWLCHIITTTFCQWTLLTSGTTFDLYSVIFIKQTNEIGYAVGCNNTVLKTTNGGNSWNNKPCVNCYCLTSISFPDANTGYAVGSSDTIYKTTDGGDTWVRLISGINTSLYDIYFSDLNTGYAVGHSGKIIKTTNGGSNWSLQNSGTNCHLHSIFFTDNNTGYVAGGRAAPYEEEYIILKTTDNGNNWFIQKNGHGDPFVSVFFTDTNIGYASHYNQYHTKNIFKTTDGGMFWTEIPSSLPPGGPIFFVSNETGYMVSDFGYIYKTTNGGQNWLSQYHQQSNDFLSSVYFTDENTGFVVGDGGTILKTTNGGGSYINENILPESAFQLYPNPSESKITISNQLERKEEVFVSIYNYQGVPVITNTFYNQSQIEIDISMLVKGVYMVKIQAGNSSLSKKLVVQ